jgi:hypothetical protein
MWKKSGVLRFGALMILACPIVAAGQHDKAIDSRGAFERLKGLVGTWNSTEKGNPARADVVTYTMTGRGTVLVEQFESSTPVMGHMLTAYHLDINRLVLTHFCGAGNQPRMRITSFDDGGRHITFDMYDITNLADPQAFHSTRLEVVFLSSDRVDLVYHSAYAEEETTQTFQLSRKVN